MFSDFYIFKCKTYCSTQYFTPLKHLISKADFTAIKYSGQGSFRVKKWMIDKLLFLLKTIGIMQVPMILSVYLYKYTEPKKKCNSKFELKLQSNLRSCFYTTSMA